MQAGSTGRKVYYLKRRWLYVAVGIMFVLLAILDAYVSNWIFAVLFLVGGIAYALMAQYYYIATSPEGIKYNNISYSVETNWANIDHVGPVKMRLMSAIPCIVLREPVIVSWSSNLAWGIPPQERGRTIPLTKDWDNLPELYRDIETYAQQVTGLSER